MRQITSNPVIILKLLG